MRTNILPSELQVGQRVAVGRYGNWRIMSQGVYVVAKANKMKVVLKREGDGYERTWSVKRNTETTGSYSDRNTFIETIESMEERNAKYQEEVRVSNLWKEAAHAAECKNLGGLKDLVAQLEAAVK